MNQHQLEEVQIVEIPDDQESKLFSCLGLDLCDVTTMRVKTGSKVRNLLGFAFKKIKDKSTRHIIFTGFGPAISKTITCVEIVKRNMKTLHQISKIFYKRTAEYWNPKEEELDRLKVTRHIPAIAILLSKESLDTKEPGYQAPGSCSALCTDPTLDKNTNKSQSRKRMSSEKTKKAKRTVKSSPTPGEPKISLEKGDGVRRKASAKKNLKKKKGKIQTEKDGDGK